MLMIPVPFVEPLLRNSGWVHPKGMDGFAAGFPFFSGETISNEPTHFEDMFSDGAKKHQLLMTGI